MTDPQYERFAPPHAKQPKNVDSPEPASEPALVDETPVNATDTPVVAPIPVHQTPPRSPASPPQFPAAATKPNPQFNAAQREYAEMLAQRRHSIDQVLQMDLEKLEYFEHAAQLRQHAKALKRNRVLFVLGWIAWIPVALTFAGAMPNPMLKLGLLIALVGFPLYLTVWAWRENARRHTVRKEQFRIYPSGSGSGERHTAFTSKQPPLRRW